VQSPAYGTRCGAVASLLRMNPQDDDDRVDLANDAGLAATVFRQGATLQSLHVPDGRGRRTDVVLGHDRAAEYLAHRHYLGATVGRHANRIAHGRFELDGRIVELDRNDGGAHHLHGGHVGFDRRAWHIADWSPRHVRLSMHSPAGDAGYPGSVDVAATYALGDDLSLEILYDATADEPTLIGLTNHSYFNLAGGGPVENHRLTLFASAYLPVGDGLIPTGEIRPVRGTPFDFRHPRRIGESLRDVTDPQLRLARGYDHAFIVDGEPGQLRPAARLEDPMSGRVMWLDITAPALQFYSGNFLDGTVVGKRGRAYRQGDGLCLEPQGYPDAPNHPAFPAARLGPGQVWRSRMRLRFEG
jgi:aldose 1-epimerase